MLTLGKTSLIVGFLITSCIVPEKNENKKPTPCVGEDSNRTMYEGKWKTANGILRIELSLEIGAPGVDSNFELFENMESNNSAGGAISRGEYTVFYGLQDDKIGVRLNNLQPTKTTHHFRQSKSWLFDSDEEMYFVSRGSNELLPSDKDFNVYDTAKTFALIKRFSKPFTIEGYITFTTDSTDFFERNTFEHWNVSEFGEYDSLQILYGQMEQEKFQGIYLKALAYAVKNDRSTTKNNSLVIKRILVIGKDPD